MRLTKEQEKLTEWKGCWGLTVDNPKDPREYIVLRRRPCNKNDPDCDPKCQFRQ